MKKEKRQLRYPGLKAGSIYGTVIFFIIPLIDTLTSENPNFISSLLNTKHIFKTMLGAFFFGVMIHIVDSLRIARAKKTRIRRCLMKSLARLLIIHVFISIFLFFALISGAVSHTVLLLLLLFLPALNKGLEKIQSKRIPVLNAALFFLLISFPQLLTNPVQWKFSIFLVVTIISSLAYFYNFYQVVKEVDQKQLI